MDTVLIETAAPLIEPPHFLGRLYDQIVHTPYLPAALYVLSLGVAIVLATLWARRQIPDLAYQIALVALPFVACLPFAAFTDEVFTSLLQVRNLLTIGRYSFDTTATTDASVSVLFYLLVAAAALVGVPVPVGAWVLGVLCLGLSAVALLALLERLTVSRSVAAIVSCAFALSPFALMTAFSGFEATLVGLLMLLALRALLDARFVAGAAYLTLLALTRFDIAFVAAAVAGLALAGERLRPQARPLIVPLMAPLLVVGLWRLYYGHIMPTPLAAKSVGLSFAFVLAGLNELNQYLARNPALLVLPLLTLLALRLQSLRDLRPQALTLLAFAVPIGGYSALILWGGGDYLSEVVGNRYLFPLHLLLLLTLAAMASKLWSAVQGAGPRRWPLALALPANALLIATMLGPAAFDQTVANAIAFNQNRFGNYARIENYGAAARLLNTYIPPQVTIASTEISSLFYYWHGRYLPLFATSNRLIATTGEPTADLLFKKVSPAAMRTHEPELAFWDAVRTESLPLNYHKLFAQIALADAGGADDGQITDLALAEVFPMQRANLDGDLLSERYRFRVLQRDDLVIFLFVHQRFVDEFDRRVGRSVVAQIDS